MQSIRIRRPTWDDEPAIIDFLANVITDTFHREGIGDKTEDLDGEIESKKAWIRDDLESGGIMRCFLVAESAGRIVGTIEYGPVSETILQGTQGKFRHLMEVGTVYVSPACRQQGIGSRLLYEMHSLLRSRGITEFCLDCGYAEAQAVWLRKFGAPDFHLTDYWGDGMHHMIWRIDVK